MVGYSFEAILKGLWVPSELKWVTCLSHRGRISKLTEGSVLLIILGKYDHGTLKQHGLVKFDIHLTTDMSHFRV